MAAKANLIMSNDIRVTAREIDFVTRFERNWQHLRDILGIMRPIKNSRVLYSSPSTQRVLYRVDLSARVRKSLTASLP